MFHVEYGRNTNILTIRVSGFWEPADVPVFATDLRAKAQQAHAIREDFDVLVESVEFPVQANNVADLLTDIMRNGMALTKGHAAIVVGSQLNKAQAERTLAHPRLRIFRTLESARNWLKEKAVSDCAATPDRK